MCSYEMNEGDIKKKTNINLGIHNIMYSDVVNECKIKRAEELYTPSPSFTSGMLINLIINPSMTVG